MDEVAFAVTGEERVVSCLPPEAVHAAAAHQAIAPGAACEGVSTAVAYEPIVAVPADRGLDVATKLVAFSLLTVVPASVE